MKTLVLFITLSFCLTPFSARYTMAWGSEPTGVPSKQVTAHPHEGLAQAVALFNGENLAGWHIDVPKMDADASIESPFIIRNGMLICRASPRGHIITDKAYQDYRLQVEYRFPSTPGNSGVLVHASKLRAYNKMFPQSMEVQLWHGQAGDFYCIYENLTIPDMEARRGPKENWGISENKDRRLQKLKDAEKPAGEWNTMIIECLGQEIKVWLNDELVNYGYDCTAVKGQIALQAEGAEIEFRKVTLAPIAKLTKTSQGLFHDDFKHRLADGWSWLREDQQAWRVMERGLEVRVQPGNMWGKANDARNVLVRPLPKASAAPLEISVVFSNAPTARWEQADLVWFYDKGNMIKLGQELVADRLTVVMGREENDRPRTIAIVPLDDYTVALRLQVVSNLVRGQFRTRYWPQWRDVGECDLPVKGLPQETEPKASLQFYNGPTNAEHWIKANDFAVRSLPAAADWPRAKIEEQTFQPGVGALSRRETRIALAQGFTLVSGADGEQPPGPVPQFDQTIHRHTDGSCGWTWNRSNPASKTVTMQGIEFCPLEFPLFTADLKDFKAELDIVSRLDIDRGDHTAAMGIRLASSPEPKAPSRQEILIWFDWYGKDWSAFAFSDGQRDYAFDAGASSDGRIVYRLQGLRGAPPKVNIKTLIDNALKRANLNPHATWVSSVWIGNQVWNVSQGSALANTVDFVVNGKRHSGLPRKQ
ncbi:MAG: DUF1080 domain-containing protein [Verrucomicrobiota bacterium]